VVWSKQDWPVGRPARANFFLFPNQRRCTMQPLNRLYRVCPAFALLFSLSFITLSYSATSFFPSSYSSSNLFVSSATDCHTACDSIDTQSSDRDKDNFRPETTPEKENQIQPNYNDENKLYHQWRKALYKKFPKELCLLEPTSVGSSFFTKNHGPKNGSWFLTARKNINSKFLI
jgi:hypothetical protein